ncbi:N-6 DNA methylase [Arthrobacter sp. B10-11]|uniref:N-6 DNA methylase n=1 Tax=Arthrobacter sp. B10-11 TaxID=3081160 RepID=UPI002954F7E2|nr:N-6 DNA methylase [Arthrobacter sp. B10-11]MDV8149718.1 N-6 DNA methylase [Arthrobacter sp. B10-11]
MRPKGPHPAVEHLLANTEEGPIPVRGGSRFAEEHTTSSSLARILAVSCLSRLDPAHEVVNIWDPAAGTGFAGSLLVEALQSAGVQARYRGQDISESVVVEGRNRFAAVPDSEIAVGDTLAVDVFKDFAADLVIVDAPWALNWRRSSGPVETRRRGGAFTFGLPEHKDGTWLFISLALEKLRAPSEGGGRVAALVHPGALSAKGATAKVRRRVLEAGFLESVTRLPEGLAPNTSVPLYLLTFSNREGEAGRGKAFVADFQTQYSTEQRRRRILETALRELESGLRTGKQGPRNRSVTLQKFIRREGRVSRTTPSGQTLSWRVTTFADTVIDQGELDSRYGQGSGVALTEGPKEFIDLDPGHLLRDDSRSVPKDIRSRGWQALRLTGLLEAKPELADPSQDADWGRIFVPTTRSGRASAGVPDMDASGRILTCGVDQARLDPGFLAAWLNSEQGIASRWSAIEASSTGQSFKMLRSDANSLMSWADELVVPVPALDVQRSLAEADDRLASFQDELSSQRERIWASLEDAEAAVDKFAKVFDDSLVGWLEELPFPVASALWTAETASSPGDKLQAYLHAWEALVVFHATVLLSACRSDPGRSAEVESAIRRTLLKHGIGIERASLGTWMVIVENTSKTLRTALLSDDPDETARVRAVFSGLREPAIERLLSKEIARKFNDVVQKRNRWQGHGGHVSDDERQIRIDSLVSDLRDIRRILGNVWAQLPLVRAGAARRVKDGYVQSAEVAVGTRSPFVSKEFHVGDAMLDGELYLVRDGSLSPLRVGHFVQLRAAPKNAHYTSYFYNRTEGSNVRMVTYQYGPESEVGDDAARFREEFGALVLE